MSHDPHDVSNTRKSVSSGYPNTEKWVEKTRRSRVFNFFNPLRGVWLPDETLFRVFDIASEQIAEIYANKDRVSKPPSRL